MADKQKSVVGLDLMPWEEDQDVMPWEEEGDPVSDKEKAMAMSRVIDAAGKPALDLIMGGYSPEFAAKMKELIGANGGKSFEQNRDEYSADLLKLDEELPFLTGASKVGGFLGSGVVAPEAFLTKYASKTAFPRIARTLLSMGSGGARAGLANVPQEPGKSDYLQPEKRLESATKGAAIAGLLSGGLEGLQAVLGGKDAAASLATKSTKPTAAQYKKMQEIDAARKSMGTYDVPEEVAAGRVLLDEGVLDSSWGLPPSTKKMSIRTEAARKKADDAVKALVAELDDTGALLDPMAIETRIMNDLKLVPGTPGYVDAVIKAKQYAEEIQSMARNPLGAYEVKKYLQEQNSKRYKTPDASVPAMQTQFEQAQATAILDELDDLASKNKGPEFSKQFSEARKKLGRLIQAEDRLSSKMAGEKVGGLSSAMDYGLPGGVMGTAFYMNRPEVALAAGAGALGVKKAIERGPQMGAKFLDKDFGPLGAYLEPLLRERRYTPIERNPWEDTE